MNRDTKFEFTDAIKLMMHGLNRYQAAHRRAYGSALADDCVLGEEWKTMAKSLLGLLNGELGFLDGGEQDHALRDIAVEAGFDRDLE